MNRTVYFLAIGLGGALVIAGGIGWLRPAKKPSSRRSPTHSAATVRAENDYVRRTPTVSKMQVQEEWGAPTLSPKNREWVFDVFTPPEIRYDAATRRFTVKPPTIVISQPALSRTTQVFAADVELLEIKRRPFRLQLVGFADTPKSTLGLFQILSTSETVFAGPGRELPELDLTVESLEVRTVDLTADGKGTNRQRIAVATIRNGRTGEVTTLTTAERRMEESSRAVLAWGHEERVIKEVGVGDRIDVNGQLCEVVEVSADPATVTLVGRTKEFDGQKIIASSPRTKSEPSPST